MKNLKNLMVLLCCFFTIHASAQFSFGVKGGYTKAWEEYGDIGLPEDAETDISGYNISALAYYRIGNHFQVGIEPGLVKRGAACEPGWNTGPNPIFEGDTELRLHYVEAPIMISGNIDLFQSKLALFGKVGYGASYLTAGDRKQFLTGIDDPATITPIVFDGSSNMNRWDHGAYGGIGLGYNLGKHQIFIESDFFMSATDVNLSNTSKNRSLDFSIGYMIRL